MGEEDAVREERAAREEAAGRRENAAGEKASAMASSAARSGICVGERRGRPGRVRAREQGDSRPWKKEGTVVGGGGSG